MEHVEYIETDVLEAVELETGEMDKRKDLGEQFSCPIAIWVKGSGMLKVYLLYTVTFW